MFPFGSFAFAIKSVIVLSKYVPKLSFKAPSKSYKSVPSFSFFTRTPYSVTSWIILPSFTGYFIVLKFLSNT